MNDCKRYQIRSDVIEALPTTTYCINHSIDHTALNVLVNSALFIASSLQDLRKDHNLTYYLNSHYIEPIPELHDSCCEVEKKLYTVVVDTLVLERIASYDALSLDAAVDALCSHVRFLDNGFKLFYEQQHSPVQVILPLSERVTEIARKITEKIYPENVHNVYTGLNLSA